MPEKIFIHKNQKRNHIKGAVKIIIVERLYRPRDGGSIASAH
jgi:hypothetical protein